MNLMHKNHVEPENEHYLEQGCCTRESRDKLCFSFSQRGECLPDLQAFTSQKMFKPLQALMECGKNPTTNCFKLACTTNVSH